MATSTDLLQQASALLAKNKPRKALKILRQGMGTMPADLRIHQKLAEVLARTDQISQAVFEYEQIAGRYAAAGKLLKSIAICKIILQIQPEHRATQAAIANLYARRQAEADEHSPLLKRQLSDVTLPSANTAAKPQAVAVLDDSPPLPNPKLIQQPVASDADDIAVVTKPVEPPSSLAWDLPVSESLTSELPSTAIFSDLPEAAFTDLLNRFSLQWVEIDERLLGEGEQSSSMYVVVQGVFSVVREIPGQEPSVVAELKSGNFFGEMALLADIPRLASVVARTPAMVLVLSREAFEDLCQKHPAVRPVVEQFYRERVLANLIRASAVFRDWSEQASSAVVAHCGAQMTPAGTTLLQQGAPGDGIYLLLRGRCTVTHDDRGVEKPYPELEEGDVFGEISMLLNRPCTATVRAQQPCVVLRINRTGTDLLIQQHPEVRSTLEALSTERLERTRKSYGHVV